MRYQSVLWKIHIQCIHMNKTQDCSLFAFILVTFYRRLLMGNLLVTNVTVQLHQLHMCNDEWNRIWKLMSFNVMELQMVSLDQRVQLASIGHRKSMEK